MPRCDWLFGALDARHLPVLAAEAIGLLVAERGGLFVDATVGCGGHSEALLKASDTARVVGIDRDPQALELAGDRLAPFRDRVQLVQGDYRDLSQLLGGLGIESVSGVLADLGVSSVQLDTPERGFSFRRDGPLDMRMGPAGPTAADVVNEYPEVDLERIFREYGEEREARRIARAIVTRRRRQRLARTRELQALIRSTKLRPERNIDPATKVFQALRIEVNQELQGIRPFLDQAVRLLEREGRLVVITYHSLEDRIVKTALREMSRGSIDQITGRPLAETRLIEVLTRKPVRPGETEVQSNPRARSGRLRAARRL